MYFEVILSIKIILKHKDEFLINFENNMIFYLKILSERGQLKNV